MEVSLVGCHSVKARMGPQAIVEIQISAEGSLRDADAVVGMQINLLVFDRFPNALDENIVAPGALAVHADRDLAGDQNAREGFARELAALVGIENPPASHVSPRPLPTLRNRR